jgi:anthranilate synthase component II
MRILLLDNHDSFTYNLLHLAEKVSGIRPEVRANDQISLEEAGAFDKILLSPGPGLPSEAGVMPALLNRYAEKKSILGICLGMQAIAECFGGSLVNLPQVDHGLSLNTLVVGDDPLFAGCPPAFGTGRYHSWVVNEATLPPELMVTARDERGSIMALSHRHLDVRGVQFHPESILSEYGDTIMRNWIGIGSTL